MKFISILSIGILFSLSGFAQEEKIINEAWKGFSDPQIFGSGFTHKLNDLPLEGSVDVGNRAWSGDYWSAKKGSINYRWNAPTKIGYKLVSPTKAEALKMTEAELATLAPSEKLDLLMSRYEYPLVREVDGVATPTASIWAGICHGWSPATLYHNEPAPKLLTNAEGVKVPFGSGDIKALISYFYAFHHDAGSDQMGLRCFFGPWTGGAAARGCQEDLNAGAFHIVLANKVGLQKEGFVMDMDRYREVWNHPIIGYKSTVVANNLQPSRDAATTAVKEIRVKTVITHADGSAPTWGTVIGTDNQKTGTQEYTYRIELNNEGKIVGGTWESAKRPDFIWNVPRATEFSGLFTALPALLND